MMDSQNYEDSVAHPQYMLDHELTCEDKKYAAAYLNETDESRGNAIAEIRQWIEESDDLCIRNDEFFILRFLRVCKFNIEKTKIKMRNYVKQRSDLPEWYSNKDPLRSELQELLDLGVFLPLRKLDSQGRMIIFVRPMRHDPRIHKLSDVLKVSMMILDVATRSHVAASLRGCAAFIDVSSPTIRHVTQLRPSIIMNIVHSWQGCYPLRIQSINFINVSEYIHVVLSIFKTFMNEKLKQRLHVYTHKTTHNSFKDIPTNILPVEYGGTDSAIQDLKEYWKGVVEDNRDWLIDDEKYKIVTKQ